MAVKERSPFDSLRGRFAHMLRAFANVLAPPPDPVTELLEHSPADDEPLFPEDAAAIEAGWQDYRAGETRPLDEVKRKVG